MVGNRTTNHTETGNSSGQSRAGVSKFYVALENAPRMVFVGSVDRVASRGSTMESIGIG